MNENSTVWRGYDPVVEVCETLTAKEILDMLLTAMTAYETSPDARGCGCSLRVALEGAETWHCHCSC